MSHVVRRGRHVGGKGGAGGNCKSMKPFVASDSALALALVLPLAIALP